MKDFDVIYLARCLASATNEFLEFYGRPIEFIDEDDAGDALADIVFANGLVETWCYECNTALANRGVTLDECNSVYSKAGSKGQPKLIPLIDIFNKIADPRVRELLTKKGD